MVGTLGVTGSGTRVGDELRLFLCFLEMGADEMR